MIRGRRQQRSNLGLTYLGQLYYSIPFHFFPLRSFLFPLCSFLQLHPSTVHRGVRPKPSMTGSSSHSLVTSSPEQDTGDLLSLQNNIKNVAREYNSSGLPKIPVKIRKTLRDRLTLAWVANPRRVASTNWRNVRARDVYQEVQSSSSHLFLAFLSVVSPTTCSKQGFEKIVAKLLDSTISVKLQLNVEAKEFFRSVAVAGDFTDNPGYIKFMNALFPEGLHGSI